MFTLFFYTLSIRFLSLIYQPFSFVSATIAGGTEYYYYPESEEYYYDSGEGAGYRGGADYDYGDHAGMEAEDYTDHPALQPQFVTSPGQIFVDPGASVNMSCSVAKWVVSHLSQYNWCN